MSEATGMAPILFFNGCHRFYLFISLHSRSPQPPPSISVHQKSFHFTLTWAASRSAMFTSDGGPKDSRKRKMKEVAAEPSILAAPQPSNSRIDYFALRGQPQVPPPGVPHVPLFGSMETNRVQRALNMAAHSRPFSYTYLLNAPDPEDYLRSFLLAGNRNLSQPIDQIIAFHGEILKNELSGMVEKLAEEKAGNKLKEKEVELQIISNQNGFLERKAEIYREQAESLLSEVKSLERTARSLRKAIKEANEERMYAEAAEEDAESYYVDPVKLGPVRLDCKTCEKQVATVMMWPCRHICVCTQCEDVTKACPVCGARKVDSVEVYLPYN